MNYQNYIRTELLILIPVLYFIGMGLKKSQICDRFIPLALGIISVVLSLIWVISTADIYTLKDIASAVFTAVTQGVLIAGASVYANQLYIQSKKEN